VICDLLRLAAGVLLAHRAGQQAGILLLAPAWSCSVFYRPLNEVFRSPLIPPAGDPLTMWPAPWPARALIAALNRLRRGRESPEHRAPT
jgi:hypothetical protein